MESWLSKQSAFLLLFFIKFLVFVEVPVSLCANNWYSSCSNRFNCGKITNVGYPFRGDGRPDACGHPDLKLNCAKDITTIEIKNLTYRVLAVNESTKILKIVREDYWGGICSPRLENTSLDPDLFDYGPGYSDITLSYGCLLPVLSTCAINGFNNTGVIVQIGAQGPGLCTASVVFPVGIPTSSIYSALENLVLIEATIKEGFDVKWKEDTAACSACTESKGVCGYDVISKTRTTCYCPDQSSGLMCSSSPAGSPQVPSTETENKSKSSDTSLVVGLGVGGAGIVGLLLGFWIFSIMRRRKRLANESKSKDLSTPPSTKGVPASSINFSQSTPSYPFLKSDLEKGSTYFGAHIFSCEELEEATDNFDSSRVLGDGGFGKVYYGKLRDGRVVAVKRLYENNFKRVEQFKTEVAILTRLRHQNLVTLYGCTSKSSQELLLVYEYIPNGTVADHLNGSRSNSSLLTWPIRLSIAIESAGALAYLHASDVIHRDVKTNNILLDENFCVKVADFGLSRLFPTDVTHISTAPQGTPGYVDPEYYQCYQLTDKSDVYSFGVVLIELISSLPAVDTNRQRHNINLANMAISKIQDHALHELVDPFLGFEKDYTIRRMTTSVAGLAFRCLQQDRDMRPSMDEVLEDLRRIQNEEMGVQKAEVVDISADDVGLLKNFPPPLSPDLVVTDKLVSISTTPNSF
ncbi:LEAF RUST 10 DISEASE-RESISTANCE LOCUS RECEPTOR-LIKE PROTEIN KINASE-like 1.3 isoform X3 [Juglans microcarpa x Juglans regia]|uniref:LEAF RUST 10 DISEASE-RESISTANCE LOCUS RECEPTOR-LIKE PROTEIN KINASE-like 1.3 isoform X3 n=1 Tax=Juglans microcarpa x Juglans regia TaxID=2249226 RepID=UPI001B7E4BBE|nr:LEAF RUST 10 DISEASE-RESISTANCE LOCUS RECEPTOR-LIKE PROTEIN KINASE-like 1.3 isoform X3 [Juglans microcarpa x Juglans regia]